MNPPPLWTPSPERVETTRMAGLFSRFGVDDYPALHRVSVEEPDRFWAARWDECGMVGDPGERVLQPGSDMFDARFFPDARLSVVEHVVRHTGPEPAIVAVDEQGTRTISWDDLAVEVGAMAAALTADGVRAGDRVVVWLPNGIEAVVAMLGAAAIGAVFSSTSPDFGSAGVLDRFGQIEPKVLFAVDGYDYGGKRFDRRDVKAEIVAGLPTLARTVTVGGAADDPEDEYDAYLAPHRGSPVPVERRPFDHPWYVLFSSGTTGKPKCIVHATGRVLLQHMKEHRFHSDLSAGDRLLYVTTCGWMMWNWLVSGLTSGVTIVCVDGNVVHPSPSRLWDLVDEHGVDFLGVGAKYLDALANADYSPREHHDLTSLRTIASTGSPLSPERFAWVYDEVKPDVHLASISGGTDLCGCFVLGDPTSPVHAGEIQRPALGMAVDVWSDDGAPQPVGVRGELVCTRPFPSQPLEFWDDPDDRRYRAAYFERFPGVWHHGDFASWTDHEGVVIHGRSDTTLNPGGIRIGTAEIYRVVEGLDGIAEALVFAQETQDDDVRIVLLVVLDAGVMLDDGLRSQIASAVRSGCSPRHVPRLIVAVDELPRTRSGKLVELAVGDVVNGREVRNTEALSNPDALWAIRDHPELAP
ncbi:MAG: acetoacetate--CoA ligase [Acidimicrobiales bacterium]|nr:acetoacetate--CoA ligase [Acidimicrobiales bacterium]